MEGKKTGKVTLADVASKAGVSTAAVSYVLGGKRGGCAISDATAKRVLECAEQLGYRKNEVAAALAMMKNAPLSLLVLSPWLYAQYSDFTVRVNGVLERSGARVQYMNYSQGGLKDVLRPSLSRRYDSVLLAGTSVEDERWLGRKREQFGNLIPINRRIEGFPFVAGNDAEAAEGVCRLVETAAYDRFVMLASPKPTPCEKMRTLGFLRALPSGEVVALDAPHDTYLPKNGERVCFFLPQYQPAAALLLSAVRRGLSVPAQVGVLCYDVHSLLEDYLPMPLTTVVPHTEEMAQAALRIARGIKEGREVRPVTVQADVSVGESVICK